MKKVFLFSLLSLFLFPVFAETFTFNGIPFGSKQGSFEEETEIQIAQLVMRKIKYSYSNNQLVAVEAQLKGGDRAMKVLADFIDIIQKKYNMTSKSYLQHEGDIINLCDFENNTITIVICEVDNENGDAELNNGYIYFTSNLSSYKKVIEDF